jgi:hypothetical protein
MNGDNILIDGEVYWTQCLNEYSNWCGTDLDCQQWDAFSA